MKLKKIKKHVKKIKITIKFDSIEALRSAYKRLQKDADEIAAHVSNSYIRVECYEKRKKLVITASGREITDTIL